MKPPLVPSGIGMLQCLLLLLQIKISFNFEPTTVFDWEYAALKTLDELIGLFSSIHECSMERQTFMHHRDVRDLNIAMDTTYEAHAGPRGRSCVEPLILI
ncbi:hypothetical protein F5Y12DRAFT_659308 [Xylaria sp. FL1777]|nr:hypothetical protein F5Y12DRAFT_659308 [Xylaria sp. FL1777]